METISSMRDGTRLETLRRYMLGVALFAAAAILRWLMGYLFDNAGPFVTFYPAVIVTILLFGYGPGLLTIVLSGLTVGIFFMEPIGALRLEEPGDIAALVIFYLSGALLIMVAWKLRKAQEARSKLAAIVESSDDAIIGKNLDGTITSWNEGAKRLYGYSAAEALGRPVSILMPPDKQDQMAGLLKQIREGIRVEHFEKDSSFFSSSG